MGMTYDAGKASQRERRGTLAEIRSGIKSGAETKAAHTSGKRLRGGNQWWKERRVRTNGVSELSNTSYKATARGMGGWRGSGALPCT